MNDTKEKWASAHEGDVIDTPADKAVVMLAEVRPPGRALDLGCGTGQNSIWLAKRGWEVAAIDIVPKAIAVAQARTTEAGVNAEVMVTSHEHGDDKRELVSAVVSASRSSDVPAST